MNRDISDKKLELLMNEAITDQYDMEIEEFEKLIEGLPDPEYSEEHKKKMRQLFARDRRESFIKNNAKKIRAACITFVCLCALSTVLLQVDAFRIQFFNMLFGTHSEYSSIDYTENEDANKIMPKVPDKWPGIYLPNKLPEGYTYIVSDNDRGYFMVEYRNEEKYVIIKQRLAKGAKQTVNAEEEEKGEDVLINNCSGQYFSNSKNNSLIWKTDDMNFVIISNDVKGIIVTFAQNLIFQKKS